MNYKDKYYKYKQKYKNLKKLSKVVGGSEDEEAAAAQGIAAIAQAAAEVAEEEAGPVAPAAPQQNQVRIPLWLLLFFKDNFINSVNDSLKLYLHENENFNYQLNTQIELKLLQCVNNWEQHVQRLRIGYPHLNFDNLNLNNYNDLVFLCIGNLILTAELGMEHLAVEDPVKRNEYLSLDDPVEGPTELNITDRRERLFDGGSNDAFYDDSDSELSEQNREIEEQHKNLIKSIKDAIGFGIADSIKQYLYDTENFNYQREQDIDKKLRETKEDWHNIVNTLNTIHPDYNLEYDYNFHNVINVFTLNLERIARTNLEQENQEVQQEYQLLNEGPIPTERIVAGRVVRKLDLD